MAIIPEQQVQTSTLRGVDPTQFLQQAYREQQANVAAFNQMNATIQQEAQKFIQKQEEKKQKEMTYSAILPYIQQMSGGDAKQADALAKQIASNPASSSAILNMVQMAQQTEQNARIRALELEELEARAEARKTPVLPFEPRKRVIDGVTYVETKAGEFKPLEGAPGTPSATAAPVGRTVTLGELQQYREEGFKPSVTVDAEGNFVLTDMGTFAPRDEGPIPLSPGQEKILEATATDLAPWGTGGKQKATQNLSKYDNVIARLLSGEVTTRNISDFTPEFLGIDDAVRAAFNPTGQDALDNIRDIVFQGLKDTLGAAFTEKEAKRLVDASYNPQLPEEMNIQRLQDARNVLEDVINAKNDLYDHIAAGGDMTNYRGVIPSDALRSGTAEVEAKYSDDLGLAGFQAPSGLTIRERKSNRPTK